MRIKYLLFVFIFAAVSCMNKHPEPIIINKPGENEMVDMNRYLIRKDRERIQNYIERKDLMMKESPTGLWFQIIDEGKGENFTDNSKIIMHYECSLLDGTECYSSKNTGPKELILGRSVIEPGLYEGLRLLKPCAKAIFILPPYLAFGLPGDGRMIPPRSIIVYSVNILQIE